MCQSRCAMRCAMTYACDQPHRIEAMIRWHASLPRDRCTRSWWLSLIEFAVPVSPKGFSFYIKSSNQTTKRWRILHQRGPSSWHLLTTFPPPWGIPWDWRSTGSRSDRQPTSQVKKLSQDFFCVPRNRVKAALRTKKNEETTQSWEVPRTHPSFARKNLENLLTSVRTKAVQGSTPRHLLDFSWDSPSWRRNPPGY